MKHKKIYGYLLLSSLLVFRSTARQDDFPVLKGPYLGQKPPGMIPEIFAPGIVSTEQNEHSPAIFSKDGNELFWSYYLKGEHVIMYMQQVNGIWTNPKKFIPTNDLKDGNPFFSADGIKLFFHSGRGEKRKDGSLNFNFWYIEKEKDGWSEAKLFDSPPNDEKWQLYGCQTMSGNFYFSCKQDEKSTEFQLHISKFNGKTWGKAEFLPEIFNSSDENWTPFVSRDESYIIFSSDRGGNGDGYNACNLFISFKDIDNEWIEPIHMGEVINTDKIERFPWVSPDEKYIFFVRGFGDIYWVDAKVIEELKPKT